MHKVHFFAGVNLTGRITLVEPVECFGLLGKTAGPLLLVMEGWTLPVELTGMFTCPNSIALVVKVCGTGLLIGKAGSPSSGRFEIRDHENMVEQFLLHSILCLKLPTQNKKVEILAWSWTSFFSVWNCLETWSNMIQVPWLVEWLHQFSLHFQWLLSWIPADLARVPLDIG